MHDSLSLYSTHVAVHTYLTHLQRDLFPGLPLFQFLIRYTKQSETETRGGTVCDYTVKRME